MSLSDHRTAVIIQNIQNILDFCGNISEVCSLIDAVLFTYLYGPAGTLGSLLLDFMVVVCKGDLDDYTSILREYRTVTYLDRYSKMEEPDYPTIRGIRASFDAIIAKIPQEDQNEDNVNIFLYTSHWTFFKYITRALRKEIRCHWGYTRVMSIANSIRTICTPYSRDMPLFRIIMGVKWSLSTGDDVPLRGQCMHSFSFNLGASYWFCQGSFESRVLLILPHFPGIERIAFEIGNRSIFQESEVIVFCDRMRVIRPIKVGYFSVYIVSVDDMHIPDDDIGVYTDTYIDAHLQTEERLEGFDVSQGWIPARMIDEIARRRAIVPVSTGWGTDDSDGWGTGDDDPK